MVSGIGLNKCLFHLEAMHTYYHCTPVDALAAGLMRKSCPKAMPLLSEARLVI
jgi:hypothetical protein